AQNPSASSKEVVAQLKQKGIQVAPSFVYYVKSQAKKAKRKQKWEQAVAASGRTSHSNPAEVVLRVKNLAREVGRIKYCKNLLYLLADYSVRFNRSLGRGQLLLLPGLIGAARHRSPISHRSPQTVPGTDGGVSPRFSEPSPCASRMISS